MVKFVLEGKKLEQVYIISFQSVEVSVIPVCDINCFQCHWLNLFYPLFMSCTFQVDCTVSIKLLKLSKCKTEKGE